MNYVVDQSTKPDANIAGKYSLYHGLFYDVLTQIFFIEDGGIHAPSSKAHPRWYRRKLTSWTHSYLVPEGFKTAIEKKFGNFVIIRSVNRIKKDNLYKFG